MNPRLAALQPYPFERLARLKAGVAAPAGLEHIAMSIGEPRHAPPALVVEALSAALATGLDHYPATAGSEALRAAIAAWLAHRYRLPDTAIDVHSMVVPLNGTREGLFALAQALVEPSPQALVAMPNPFYQIYEGAALLAGATPCYLAADASSGFVPDFAAVPPETWRRCQLLYLCSPGNPTGAVLDANQLEQILALADRYDFVVASDECYAEIYPDEGPPPPGLLQVCHALGRDRFERCVVFHSLSKRSSVPGLRSGFAAGDPRLLARYLLYRTYHGCAMPPAVQQASIAAWSDEMHVAENRRLYAEKFRRVLPILDPVLEMPRPQAAFYLWPRVGDDDEGFARELYRSQNVTVLPGSYLSRRTSAGDPGRGRIRISLVPSLEDCVVAAQRIRRFVEQRPRGER